MKCEVPPTREVPTQPPCPTPHVYSSTLVCTRTSVSWHKPFSSEVNPQQHSQSYHKQTKQVMKISRNIFQTFRDDLSLQLGVAWFVAFLDLLNLTITIPIYPAALRECQESALLNGILLTAKAASQLVTLLVLARFIDGHKILLIHIGCVGVVFSQFLFVPVSLQHNYYAWLAGRIVLGMSSAPLLASGLAILQERFKEKEKRARVVGYAMTGGSLGVVLGPILGGTLYSANPVSVHYYTRTDNTTGNGSSSQHTSNTTQNCVLGGSIHFLIRPRTLCVLSRPSLSAPNPRSTGSRASRGGRWLRDCKRHRS